MNKYLIFLLLFPVTAFAQEVTIEWNSVDRAEKYNVYRGGTPDALVKLQETTETQYQFTYQGSSIYCFGVSAQNQFGESAIAKTTDGGEPVCLGKPEAPTGLSFTVQ